MSTEYLYIYLCLLQLLSSTSYGFQFSFTSLVKFVSRHFILFDAVVHRTVFLISLFDILLLICRNKRFLYWLSYSTLPTLLIGSKSFLVWSLGFYVYNTMSFSNSDSFISSFLILMIFTPFLCLIVLPRTLCWIKVIKVSIRVLFLILE